MSSDPMNKTSLSAGNANSASTARSTEHARVGTPSWEFERTSPVRGNSRRHAVEYSEAAQHKTAVNVLDAGRGLGGKEHANSRKRSGFGDSLRIESPRHRCRSHRLAKDIGKHFDTAAPFFQQLRGRQMRHPFRMGKRMTADDVPAAPKGTNLVRIQKARRTNIASGD